MREGRIRVDEPTDLPEGTVLDLVVDDEGDDLDDTEWAALEEHLRASLAEADAGLVRPYPLAVRGGSGIISPCART